MTHIFIPALRKRPFIEASGENKPQENFLPLQQPPTNCTAAASRPVLDNVQNVDSSEASYVTTKTRTKRVKLKMGGTSFRTVDKIWAAP